MRILLSQRALCVRVGIPTQILETLKFEVASSLPLLTLGELQIVLHMWEPAGAHDSHLQVCFLVELGV